MTARSILSVIAPSLLASTLAATVSFSTSLAHAQTTAVAPAIDVVFVVDATGSMRDEIAQVRNEVFTMAASLAYTNPAPDYRFGLVFYRDIHDTEPLRVVPLTRRIQVLHDELAAVRATGGGDTAEDVYSGLAASIYRMDWNQSAQKLVFLIGDARPQEYGTVDRSTLIADANGMGIKIDTIGAVGLDSIGELAFRSIAEGTGGTSDYLTYYQDLAYSDGSMSTLIRHGNDFYVSLRPLLSTERGAALQTLSAQGLIRPANAYEVAAVLPTQGRALRIHPERMAMLQAERAVQYQNQAVVLTTPTNDICQLVVGKLRSAVAP